MGLTLSVATVAALLGVLAGGRPGGREQADAVRVRSVWLLGVAAALNVAAALAGLAGGTPAYLGVLALTALCAATFLARNPGLPGVPLVAAGLLLNGLVVAANGAMPVSSAAAARAGVAEERLALTGDPRRELVTADTRLVALADVVPVPSPVRAEVVSVGDVLVAAGIGLLVLAGVRTALPGRREETARPLWDDGDRPGRHEEEQP